MKSIWIVVIELEWAFLKSQLTIEWSVGFLFIYSTKKKNIKTSEMGCDYVKDWIMVLETFFFDFTPIPRFINGNFNLHSNLFKLFDRANGYSSAV